jgi:hypothetical protein
MRIFEVLRDDASAQDARVSQRVLGLWEHVPPVLALGLGQIDGDESRIRRACGRTDIERAVDRRNELIVRIECVDQPNDIAYGAPSGPSSR